MSSAYPVQIDVMSPPHFDRMQLLLRIAIAILLGWLGLTAGWLACLLFGALPLIAAVAISSRRAAYLQEVAPQIWSVLDWLLQLSAYMLLLVDRFPGRGASSSRFATRGSRRLVLRSRGSSRRCRAAWF
jgi:hypothetical protein